MSPDLSSYTSLSPSCQNFSCLSQGRNKLMGSYLKWAEVKQDSSLLSLMVSCAFMPQRETSPEQTSGKLYWAKRLPVGTALLHHHQSTQGSVVFLYRHALRHFTVNCSLEIINTAPYCQSIPPTSYSTRLTLEQENNSPTFLSLVLSEVSHCIMSDKHYCRTCSAVLLPPVTGISEIAYVRLK